MNRLLSAAAGLCGAYCLAELGGTCAAHLPNGGKVTLKLEPGVVEGPVRTSPESPDRGDWTLLLRKREE
jgi:hypothetical protein